MAPQGVPGGGSEGDAFRAMNPGPISILAAVLAAGGASWSLVALVIRLAPRLGLLDRPNERSLHTRVTPRGGGIGFVVVMALAPGVLLAVGVNFGSPLPLCLGAALLISAVSLRDDFKSLSSGLRFVCQLAAATAAVASSTFFVLAALPGLGTVDFGWLGAVLTVLWIVGLTNVYNFMDGIDGIAGVQGLTAGLAWAAAGWHLGSPEIELLGAMLAGGCLGFLIHNWSPARIFMGDVGSAFLGFFFAVLPLLALSRPPPLSMPAGQFVLPLFGLLVVWPFVGDGLYTFSRRAWRREVVWKPHRSHLYQRLVQIGWSHARVSSLYAVWCAVSALVGWLWLVHAPGAAITAVAFPLSTLAGLVLLVRARERAHVLR